MILALADAQAYVEHVMGRPLTDAEAEAFRAHIRRAYRERGLL